MLRSYVQGKLEEYFPIIEFSYNNSYQSAIKMARLEALYGRKCRTPLCWSELNEGLINESKLI